MHIVPVQQPFIEHIHESTLSNSDDSFWHDNAGDGKRADSHAQKSNWIYKRGAQPVADLVSKLLSPVIEQRAGMTTDLIASWDYIAGAQHAEKSRPEKLLWPRQAQDDDPFEPATLVVACEGGHALYLQHDLDAVVGRINTYFGFAAVARIKLTQKPIARPQVRKSEPVQHITPAGRKSLEKMLEGVTDPNLRKALEKMGKGVFSTRSDKSR